MRLILSKSLIEVEEEEAAEVAEAVLEVDEAEGLRDFSLVLKPKKSRRNHQAIQKTHQQMKRQKIIKPKLSLLLKPYNPS